MKFYENVDGLTEASGFFCGGIHCDVRGKRDGRIDLGIVYSKRPCSGAGVFTTNDVKAAPVLHGQAILAEGNKFHAIVVNSGNANACTGPQGEADTRTMASEVARQLKLEPEQVFVCSTGRIGEPLPMSRITAGIRDAVQDIEDEVDGGMCFQQAILTSDTTTKSCLAEFETPHGTVRVAGVAKGSGMIEPNMATMLAFIVTDASLPSQLLQDILKTATDKTFNRITIDGDMSTNDTVLTLANGFSNVDISEKTPEVLEKLQTAIEKVCACLARKMIGDGEKVTKLIELSVTGAPSDDAAEKVARNIANSLLVKTSWYGSDPNWGRIVDAAGYAKIGVDFSKIELFYNEVPVLAKGKALTRNKDKWKEVVAEKQFTIHLELNLGQGTCNLLTTDLSEAYVGFNKSE
jgi:glutamate N-acetyltransferase/amino-acid N-acetyltransferase